MIVCFDVQDEQHFFLSFFFLSYSCDLNATPALLTRTFASGLKSVMPPIFKAPLVFTFLFGSSSFLFYLCSIISIRAKGNCLFFNSYFQLVCGIFH